MTRKKKYNSESNSFVAAAIQVCLQPVLEHRQRHRLAGHSTHLLQQQERHRTHWMHRCGGLLPQTCAVGLSVCLLDTTVSPTKTTEPIAVAFTVQIWVGPKNLVGARIP